MEKMLQWEGEPVLHYSINLPEVPKEGRFKPVQAFYKKLGETWAARWEGVYFKQAAAALMDSRARSKPFEPWKAELCWVDTYRKDHLWSLYLDVKEHNSIHRPYCYRQGDTWDLTQGTPCTLQSFFDDCPKWRQGLLAEVKRQIGQRIRSGESLLDQNAAERAEKEFDPTRFYLTESGVALFYPTEVLGSAGEGIPVFVVKRSCTEGEDGI